MVRQMVRFIVRDYCKMDGQIDDQIGKYTGRKIEKKIVRFKDKNIDDLNLLQIDIYLHRWIDIQKDRQI